MPMLRRAAIIAFYAAVACLITYPLVLHLDGQFAGFAYGDAYENARHIWWFSHALQTGQPLFFQPLFAYPNGLEGITLWATPLLIFPAWLLNLALPLPTAFNLQLLITLTLNGFAMYCLARTLKVSRLAALLAGVVFAAFPTLQGHIGVGHLNVITQWPLPFYAALLVRLSRDQQSTAQMLRLGIGAALLFLLTAFGHTLQVIYTLLPVTSFFIIGQVQKRQWRAALRILLSAGAGALLLLVYLLPVLDAAFSSTYRAVDGSVRYSADLLALITPSFFHPVWGQLDFTRQVLGVNLDEGAAYIGLVTSGLIVLALWRHPPARPWFWFGAAAYLLALGPLLKLFDQPLMLIRDGFYSHIALPWAAVSEWPLLELARTPARFNFSLMLAAGVLAAYGAERVTRSTSRFKTPLVVVLCGLILLDYQTFWPLPLTEAQIPQGIADLRSRQDVRAVLDIPWNNLLAAKQALYLQTAHQHPLIAGQVTRQTPVDPAMLSLLEQTLDPALLDAAGADLIIVHKDFLPFSESWPNLHAALGRPVYEDAHLAVFEPPTTEQSASWRAVPADGNALTWYVYVPSDGWLSLSREADADAQEATLWLDEQPIQSRTDTPFSHLPIPVRAGYHTLSLSPAAPCPSQLPAGVICVITAERLRVEDFRPARRTDEAAFTHGARSVERALFVTDSEIEVWLAWAFDSPISDQDVRYVHLLDDAGRLIAQADSTLGSYQTGESAVETVSLPLPAPLAPGRYRVVVGWYHYPDLTPYLLVDGSQTLEVGQAEIGLSASP